MTATSTITSINENIARAAAAATATLAATTYFSAVTQKYGYYRALEVAEQDARQALWFEESAEEIRAIDAALEEINELRFVAGRIEAHVDALDAADGIGEHD